MLTSAEVIVAIVVIMLTSSLPMVAKCEVRILN